jgi:carboxypeptidase C (cathepsin A)
MIDIRRSVLALVMAFAATAGLAQERTDRPAGERGHPEPGRQEQNAPGVLSLLPGDAVTEHSIDTPFGKLSYTATAGTFSLFDQSGERSAAVFYTAYVAKTNDQRRPLTFVRVSSARPSLRRWSSPAGSRQV